MSKARYILLQKVMESGLVSANRLNFLKIKYVNISYMSGFSYIVKGFKMKYEDIVRLQITEEMIKIAEDEEKKRKSKHGIKTRALYTQDGEVRRDLVGSLAHQVVERALDRLNLPYYSTRNIEYCGGDLFDIKIDNDFIDVKGSIGYHSFTYFSKKEFSIFENQLTDKKTEKITHFCFVLVGEGLDYGYIYGVISREKFMSFSKELALHYKNRGIGVEHLQSFTDYVYRT